jgi:hypothetical protein
MNREIKFRAWHILDKEIVYFEDWESIRNLARYAEYNYVDNITQYTELKDKNGKEIYEGDILSGYPHGSSIVKWDNEYGCWHSGFDLIGNEIKDMPEREVIGNIYENPELL